VKDIMSGEKRVRAVVAEIKEQNDFSLSPVDPKEEQTQALKDRILTTARSMRRTMDDMFSLTKWNNEYKKLHRELRTIIFDE